VQLTKNKGDHHEETSKEYRASLDFGTGRLRLDFASDLRRYRSAGPNTGRSTRVKRRTVGHRLDKSDPPVVLTKTGHQGISPKL